MVIEASESEARALGIRSFRVRPCRGDYMTETDADGIETAYEVHAVVHPAQPSEETYGELIVRRWGSDATVRMALHAGRRPS